MCVRQSAFDNGLDNQYNILFNKYNSKIIKNLTKTKTSY